MLRCWRIANNVFSTFPHLSKLVPESHVSHSTVYISVKHVIIQKVTSWDHLIAHILLFVVSGDTFIPKFPAQMSHIVIYKTVYPWVPVKAFLQPTNTIHNFIPFITLRTGQQCGVSPSSIYKPPRYI
jgi:hypothetical protein